MLYDDYIDTEEKLREFVLQLNELTHWEKYHLFYYVFETKMISLRPKGYDNNRTSFYIKWVIPVGKFGMYVTTKINTNFPRKNPEARTGFHEAIYFHLNPEDKGISQIST